MIRVYSKILLVRLFWNSVHIASPYLFFKKKFEFCLSFHFKPLIIDFHLGNRWIYFIDNKFIEFWSYF